jgi:protein-tyrosine phosphatase
MKKKKPLNPVAALRELYVVGRRTEGFCWLLPDAEGDSADDQNLDAARHFSSLTEAIASSTEHCANVFEIIKGEDGIQSLDELLIDLDKIKSVPFDSCYWLMDKILIGPNPICLHACETEQRVKRLRRAGVRTVISFLDRTELFWSNEDRNELWLETFRHHVFPIRDGGVPTPSMASVILDVIDEAINDKQTTYLHCFGGRGRSGLLAAAFASRHSVATGERVLNFLARRRFEYGLFEPSPETEEQRQFVRDWKPGQ